MKIRFVFMIGIKLYSFLLLCEIILTIYLIINAVFPTAVLISVLIIIYLLMLINYNCVEINEKGVNCKRRNKTISEFNWEIIKEIGIRKGPKFTCNIFSMIYISQKHLDKNEIQKLVWFNKPNQTIVCLYSKKAIKEICKHYSKEIVGHKK